MSDLPIIGFAPDEASGLPIAIASWDEAQERIEQLEADNVGLRSITLQQADRIAELSETWTDERGEVWSPPTAWAYAQACKALHAAKAEREAARADAERYRWLRNSAAGQWEHPIVVSQKRQGDRMQYVGPLGFKELDAAIDAARNSSK
jgi:hypothetical protein